MGSYISDFMIMQIKNYWKKKSKEKLKNLKKNEEKVVEIKERLKKLNFLRYDFEKIRILCDLCLKREKIKDKIYKLEHENYNLNFFEDSKTNQNKKEAFNITSINENEEYNSNKDIKYKKKRKKNYKFI
jgi:hypothetical protein